MKKVLILMMFITLLGIYKIFAADPQDTLILLDGRVITGRIEDKSFEVLNNAQVDINTWYTLIDQVDGKPIKVKNKEINYFIISGVKYGNRPLVMGNKMLRIIIEGPASIYGFGGTVTNHYTRTDNTTNPKFETTTTTSEKVQFNEILQIVIKGKKKPYSDNLAYRTKHFDQIFDQCPKLIEESKKPGFDFNDLEGIIKKYNACF